MDVASPCLACMTYPPPLVTPSATTRAQHKERTSEANTNAASSGCAHKIGELDAFYKKRCCAASCSS